MELSDNAWSIIEPLIPKPKIRSDRRGRPWKCTRLVLDGIVWILRTGAPWRYLPEHYPSYPTCHRRFQQWTADGTLRSVLVHLSALLDGGSADEAFIDGSYAGANNGGSCVGRCRAGKATKVMVLADGAGLSLSVTLADGSRHAIVLTEQTLDAAFTERLPGKHPYVRKRALDMSMRAPCQASSMPGNERERIPLCASPLMRHFESHSGTTTITTTSTSASATTSRGGI